MSVVEDSRKSPEGITLPDSGSIGSQLRAISILSDSFRKHLGRSLAVNDTDLSAMEHLMTDGPLTPSELSRRLGVSTAATTVVVDRLVGLGHVHREAHAHDRRKVVVVPTPASVRAAFETLMPVLAGVAEMAERLTDTDRTVVSTFLADVIDVYRGALPSEN